MSVSTPKKHLISFTYIGTLVDIYPDPRKLDPALYIVDGVM